MRKFQRAAVVAAMLGSVSFLGAGVGHAGGGNDCDMNDFQQGLIQLDDVNVNVAAILAVANQDASEKEFMHCKGH
ncbi:hypothetical protein ABT063_08160 [Streptomyces sp. NPDC002838]|uniref:hypothetical protein n=1 Tax=Streptomyces sp. NPDC002838 TaxID=3154436 RepID=UPI003323316D